MTDKRLLGGYLRTISNALSQDLQQQAEQLGLTSSQGMFLHHIWKRRQEGLETYARDLEEFFYIKHSTVSGILQRMEAAGFIALRAKEDDKRCKAIELRQKAIDAHDAIEKHLRSSEEQLLGGMTEAEQATFRRLLQIAAKNLGVGCKPPAIKKNETEA